MASIQLFIYLYGPIIEKLNSIDFNTLKLETGLHLWIPLINACQPYRGPLSAPVKFDLNEFGKNISRKPSEVFSAKNDYLFTNFNDNKILKHSLMKKKPNCLYDDEESNFLHKTDSIPYFEKQNDVSRLHLFLLKLQSK